MQGSQWLASDCAQAHEFIGRFGDTANNPRPPPQRPLLPHLLFMLCSIPGRYVPANVQVDDANTTLGVHVLSMSCLDSMSWPSCESANLRICKPSTPILVATRREGYEAPTLRAIGSSCLYCGFWHRCEYANLQILDSCKISIPRF